MTLAHRLAALERRSSPSDPELIIVHGGVPGSRGATTTTIGGQNLQCGEEEPIGAFHKRCIAAAREAGQAFVILGGLPNE